MPVRKCAKSCSASHVLDLPVRATAVQGMAASAERAPGLQVPGWTREQLLAFWKRWYLPANATLFIVGDFDRPVPQIEALIHRIFDPIPAGQPAAECAPCCLAIDTLAATPCLQSSRVCMLGIQMSMPPAGWARHQACTARLHATAMCACQGMEDLHYLKNQRGKVRPAQSTACWLWTVSAASRAMRSLLYCHLSAVVLLWLMPPAMPRLAGFTC